MDFIEGFIDAVKTKRAPDIFALWGGITTVAIALERKVWVRTRGNNLFPNLYTFLVGSSGSGKTLVTDFMQTLLTQLEDHYIAWSSLTRASFSDELNESVRRAHLEGEGNVDYNALAIIMNELGVLLDEYSTDFLQVLTDVYDCKRYAERRRTSKLNISIPNPQVNLLGGCTPAYLQELLPESAWEQGFLSRVIMVYHSGQIRGGLFAEEEEPDVGDLLEHVQAIGDRVGQMRFTKDAKEFLEQWDLADGPPKPNHPKLETYCSRRTLHLLKLSMIASHSSSDTFIIDVEHINRALNWLMEAEAKMPEVFKAMTHGGDARIMREVYHYVTKLYIDGGRKPIPEHQIMYFMHERASAHAVPHILKAMLSQELFIIERNSNKRFYRPGHHFDATES